MNGEEVRRTTRKNAGTKPDRFGQSSTHVNHRLSNRIVDSSLQNPSSRQEEDGAMDSPSSASCRSTRSRASHHSTSVRQEEVDLNVEMQAAALEEAYDQKLRAYKLLQFDIKTLMDLVESLKEDQEVRCDSDVSQQNKDKMQKAEEDIKSKSVEAGRAKLELDFDEQSLQRKLRLLKKKGDLEKQKIDEDEGHNSSQDVSDEEDSNSISHTIIDRAERDSSRDEIRYSLKRGATTDINNDNEDEYADEDRDLLARLRRLQHIPTAEEAIEPKRTSHTSGVDNPTRSGTDQLAEALARAFEKIPQQSNSAATERFLARQVHGKDLPIFYGRPEEWVTFITCYRNTTTACRYDDTDNLIRLQRCLRGDAMKTVQCLMSTPNNVEEIMQILETRFGQPEHIVDALMEKATSLHAFREDRLDNLIEFGIAVKNLTTTIISLNCLDHLNNPSLLKELEHKLPVSLRLRWSTWLADFSMKKDLKNFCTWMDRQTNAACRLCPPKVKADDKERKGAQPWRERRNERIHVAAESKPNDRPQGGRNSSEKKCSFCKKPAHRIMQCDNFLKEDNDAKWKWIRENRHCFGCLNFGHGLSKCRIKKECGKDNCQRFHHQLLHKEKEEDPPEDINIIKSSTPSRYVHMMIVPVRLKGPTTTISTLAMLDPGASVTLLDSEIANQLGLQGVDKPLRYNGLHPTVTVSDSKSVNLELITADGKKTHLLNNVRTTGYLPLPFQSVRRQLLNRWNHLKSLNIKTYEGGQPKILIGLDNTNLIMSREFIPGPPNAPSAARTELGWVLCGKTMEMSNPEHGFMVQEEEHDVLHQLVKKHFATEAFGVMVTGEKPRCKEDKYAQSIMDNTIKRVGDQWESGLLWKSEDTQLPATKSMALNRLYQMEKKMDRSPEFAKQYMDKIQEYIDKGFAEVLTKEEAKYEPRRTFYLPHFMAKNPKKPKKLRFVFDAAAKVNGVSLNDTLLIGPDQLTSMPPVLFKFRQRKIGLTADIADMFHRVRIRQEDASAQRFLWRGMKRDQPPDVYEMRVLIFGATCSPACAQEAKNKNAMEFIDQYPEAAKAIIERHYVDDYLDSCDSVEEAVARFHEVHHVHKQGSFNICKWVVSSSDVLEKIPEELRAHDAKAISEKEDKMERVLGLFWKPQEDQFTFTMNFLKAKEEIFNQSKLPTKREVLALVMSIYDPLGFLSIFTVRAKIILQEIWRSKIGWDDEIAGGARDKWSTWMNELNGISKFQVPRCYSQDFSTAESLELHIFCDASEQAFGAACYFRIQKNHHVAVSFVMSKARVAPLKSLSIPRMELQAAVMGSRLGRFIQDEHEIKASKIVYWSDNQTVLSWITSDSKKFKQFVAHRVGEIQELTNAADWKWVPTKENVADELTRDVKPCDWSPSSRWVNGPEFLLQPENEWPKNKSQPVIEVSADEEIKKEFLFFAQVRESIIDITRYSRLTRLLRATAYVCAFVELCRIKKQDRKPFPGLFPQQIEQAEKFWIKVSQADCFAEEIHLLEKHKAIPKTSRLLKLSIIMDEEGILRIDSRISRAIDLQHSTKFPIILDPKHQFTKLLVMDYHVRSQHHGMERVVNEIRQKYHIMNLRAAVRSSWTHCQVCKNQRAKPTVPQMAPLPSFRLQSHLRPFTTTGLDYFGPMEVKVGRRHEKRYGALFTCLTTRAVHLEIATFFNTDSCIMAIRRFIGRRGCPVEIWSDNGTNFKGSKNELKAAIVELNQGKLTNECTNHGIVWKFIPPAAPHMGGSWERMVRSVKVALHATLKERYPTDEILQTLMVEAEHIVNSHPLTHVPLDPEDPEALTPNHFLVGASSNVPVLGIFMEDDMFLRKHWRKAQLLADYFWKRWVREYVPTLLRRNKWFRRSEPIQLGDIVIEVNEHFQRNSWPKGIVIKLYPGQDQLVRAVDVKFASGVLKRPVAKLAVLDVRSPTSVGEIED